MEGLEVTETDAVVAEYAEWLESWAARKTVRARTIAARAYLNDCGGLAGVSPQSLNRFLGKPKANGQPKEGWTKATYHSHAKSFCQFLMAAGYIDEDPLALNPGPTRPRGKPRPLSEREVERVLDVARGDERDWIVVALATGLRVSEIAALRGENVNSDGIYVHGKGDLTVCLPAHEDVLEIAERMPAFGYWWTGPEDGHVRSQLITIKVGRIFSDLGIKGSIHRCRHTFGTRLIRSGVHIRTAQQMMRHASLQTTANYSAVDEDEMKKALLAIPRAAPPDSAA